MTAALLVAGLVAVYLASCAIWPYTACPACEGGKHRSPSNKNWRDCRRCQGSGTRRRFGHRLLNRRKRT